MDSNSILKCLKHFNQLRDCWSCLTGDNSARKSPDGLTRAQWHGYSMHHSRCLLLFLVAVQNRNSQSFAFLKKLNRPHWRHTSLTYSWCGLTLIMTWTDTEWTYWLAADAWVRKHKHKFENDSDSCSTIHRLYAACKEYTMGSTMAEQVQPQPLIATSCRHHPEEMLPMRLEHDLHPYADINDLFVENSKLSRSAHLCPNDGSGQSVLFFIKSGIITSWRSV